MQFEKVFIFDLDGTLIDSKLQISRSLNAARASHNHKPLEYGKIFSLIGLPVEYLFADLEIDSTEETLLIQDFRSRLALEVKKDNPVFPGVVNFLTKIRERNIGLCVATSKPHDLAIRVIENSTIANFFDHVQGTNNFPGKPNPEVILRTKQAVPSTKYLMFGDRIEDIQASLNAGVPSIGIFQGFHGELDLLNAGADAAYSDFFTML